MFGRIRNGKKMVMISVSQLLVHIHGKEESVGLDDSIIQKDIDKFLEDNNAHYFTSKKKEFSTATAFEEANQLGKQIVLVEIFN